MDVTQMEKYEHSKSPENILLPAATAAGGKGDILITTAASLL